MTKDLQFLDRTYKVNLRAIFVVHKHSLKAFSNEIPYFAGNYIDSSFLMNKLVALENVNKAFQQNRSGILY